MISSEGPGLEIDFVPDVPAGATGVRVTTSGGRGVLPPDPAAGREGDAFPPVRVRVVRGEPTEIVVTWDGGLAVAPPRIELEPGQRSEGLRILDLEADGDEWSLTIEGTAGHEYVVDLFGSSVEAAVIDGSARLVPRLAEGAGEGGGAGEAGGPVAGNTRLRVEFAEGEGRQEVTLRLTPSG